MRVLFLSPGDLEAQLKRLPLAAAIGRDLKASIQVACPLAAAPLWKLLPVVEKQRLNLRAYPGRLGQPAGLRAGARFPACLNFASGWNLDLLLSLSHIPVRVARGGFSCTAPVAADAPAGRSSSPWACRTFKSRSASACCPKPSSRPAQTTSRRWPLLLLAPSQTPQDWSEQHWSALEEAVRGRIKGAAAKGCKAAASCNKPPKWPVPMGW